MKAFPHTFDQTLEDGRVATVTRLGMDLRDWFAGLAMQGLIAAQGKDVEYVFTVVTAYEIAEGMMEIRNENNK